MSFSQMLADSVFARLFRGDTRHAQLAVSMVGPKLGDRLLVIGLSDPRVLIALAAKVGITGRACGIDTNPEAAERAKQAAAKAGVLVELTIAPRLDALPFDPASFEVAVVRAAGTAPDQTTLIAAVTGARRVLRDGGRCLIVRDSARRGNAGGDESASYAPELASMKDAGYRGARVLADREGMAFIEAVNRANT